MMESCIDSKEMYWKVISNAKVKIENSVTVQIPERLNLTMVDCSDCSDCSDNCFCGWGG